MAERGVVATSRGVALLSRVADECSRVPGQVLSEEEEAAHVDSVRAARDKESDAWEFPGVFEPLQAGDLCKSAAHIRWGLTWEMVEGVRTADARSVAKGSQDRDLKMGIVDTSACVGVRSSRH